MGNSSSRRGQKQLGGAWEGAGGGDLGGGGGGGLGLGCILKVEPGGCADRLDVGVREPDESRVSPGCLASGSGRMGLSLTEMGRTGRRGLRGKMESSAVAHRHPGGGCQWAVR